MDTKELIEPLRDVLDIVPVFTPCGYIPISSKTLACCVSTFSTDVRRPRIRFLEEGAMIHKNIGDYKC